MKVDQEFRAGDKVQFTRDNYSADRKNGHTASSSSSSSATRAARSASLP